MKLRKSSLWMAVTLAAACSTAPTAPASPADSAQAADAAVAVDAGTADGASSTDVQSGPTDIHAAPADYDKTGPFAVGFAAFDANDAARQRKVRMAWWYPTAAPATSVATAQAAYGDAGKPLADLFAAVTPTCVKATQLVAVDAQPLAGLWPTVAFSHCSGCYAASSAGLAERLASHGFIVVAPDHPPNTVFEALAGKAFVGLSAQMLELRVGDIRFALDLALDPTASAVPTALANHCDPARVGVYGHSFGSMTTGRVLRDDPRVRAGVGIAAPMDTPLVGNVKMADIKRPVALLLAVEDNSIGQIGNQWLRENYAAANAPAVLVEVADAGHFSFSDAAGLRDAWPGCGAGLRQTDGAPFTYVDAAKGRAVAARVLTAWFARFLRDEPKATDALQLPWPASVTVVLK